MDARTGAEGVRGDGVEIWAAIKLSLWNHQGESLCCRYLHVRATLASVIYSADEELLQTNLILLRSYP